MAGAGAKRIRILESFFPARQDMELWARYGLDTAAIGNCGTKVEWENTNNLGRATKYTRLNVPGGGLVFPAYDLNHSFADCDAYVSMSKLKNHWIGGVTMTMKNNFGLTPCSLYGGDAGPSGNEDPRQERVAVGHDGNRTPPKGVPQELHPDSPRDPGYRVPRIVVDLCAVRPVDLSIVDGIETIRGGEGEWNQGVEKMTPGLLIVGRNQVCTDAVCTAVMGYDPRAVRGQSTFVRGDNALRLAEAAGLGSADTRQHRDCRPQAQRRQSGLRAGPDRQARLRGISRDCVSVMLAAAAQSRYCVANYDDTCRPGSSRAGRCRRFR